VAGQAQDRRVPGEAMRPGSRRSTTVAGSELRVRSPAPRVDGLRLHHRAERHRRQKGSEAQGQVPRAQPVGLLDRAAQRACLLWTWTPPQARAGVPGLWQTLLGLPIGRQDARRRLPPSAAWGRALQSSSITACRAHYVRLSSQCLAGWLEVGVYRFGDGCRISSPRRTSAPSCCCWTSPTRQLASRVVHLVARTGKERPTRARRRHHAA
jgi:hypothetical protein